jgi:hypothetical protein
LRKAFANGSLRSIASLTIYHHQKIVKDHVGPASYPFRKGIPEPCMGLSRPKGCVMSRALIGQESNGTIYVSRTICAALVWLMFWEPAINEVNPAGAVDAYRVRPVDDYLTGCWQPSITSRIFPHRLR